MVYTQLQLSVFNAAYQGAMSGFLSDAGPLDPNTATYLVLCNTALAMSQQLDTSYGATGASDANSISLIQEVTSGFTTGRTPISIVPADYAATVLAILAAVNEANVAEAAFITLASSQTTTFRARNVVQTNVASLAAYTVAAAASNDNVLGVQGDIVLLVAQTAPAQNGPWQIGVVAAGTAPLTRPSWWQTATVIKTGQNVRLGGEGTIFKNTTWQAMTAADSFTVDTNDPQMFPLTVTVQRTLVAGQATVVTVPIRSVNAGVLLSRTTANTSAATVMYAPTVAGATGITPGAIGTASLTLQGTVAAGTINAADVSTLNVTINNQL